MAHSAEKCDAPICVKDPNYQNNSWSWFPDEAICKAQPWTHVQKVQKKIQKLFNAGKINNRRYFTPEMLKKIYSVREGIKGLNPDKRTPSLTHPETSNPLVPRSSRSSDPILVHLVTNNSISRFRTINTQ